MVNAQMHAKLLLFREESKKDLYSNGFKHLQFCGIENHDIANIVLG